ncbi:MAG: cysteine sulfinate desulfinase [Bacteroidetes bacterium RIFOXYA12_FULL_35_11]|nr:MAG: cysteine sulfinate desulfinase [Bacteroidetes bacterium GWF2_35_48]OFY72578.1 MAG: cysteine sulfinate desulfinase [Bacteroidetes bacterium RIFOXYA12_FULL_35_11]OFY95692.1 MAG: cysteine sulfinate desulfinase [Bacteroidetes bacterium RIFOXYC12_FULL_35_7]HBX49558.1 cysteine desulfurase CsdA [Bacteroidales bacterium]
MPLDILKIRKDFPILSQQVYGKPLVYFDNAATTQKPLKVIDTISEAYKMYNSNIHRGVHHLSEKSSEAYENARAVVQKFINAKFSYEIIFTRGTTESINLVAFSFGERYIREGDEIILSTMEHHSNLVPWQMLCERKKAKLKVIPMNANGELILDEMDKLFTPKTKIVAVTHISNSLGTINPIKEIIKKAHDRKVPVLIDAAQSVQHTKIDVQDLDCDFFAFSGHKLYGPTGIGVLYGKEEYLNEIPPYQGGGDMIHHVTFEKTVYNKLPFKFEAGTANYIDAIGLAVAIDYLTTLGIYEIAMYEHELLQYAASKLQTIEDLIVYGNAKYKSSVFSFLLKGIHHYDTGMILDKLGIAVRTGSHCTQPVMDFLKIPGTVRASFAFYNTKEEIDVLYEGLLKVKQMMS